MMTRGDRLKIFFVCVLVLANFFIWVVIFSKQPKDYVTVGFLDVGQGDAIFIEGPTGNQMLVDGGPNKKVLRGLGKLMPFYDRSIDLLIVTHPDTDHITGLIDVVSKYKVLGMMSPGVSSDTAVYKTLEKNIFDKNLDWIVARRGMRIDIGGGAYADILFPDRNVSGIESNDASIILRLVYGESEVLLSGDSPQKIENYITGIYGENLQADILKAGHHGSKTSSSNYFLSAVNPEYFIISAEENSRYGHPHKEVMDLAKSLNINILETSKEGNIVFILKDTRIIKK